MSNVISFPTKIAGQDLPKYPPVRYEFAKKGARGEIFLYGVIGSIFDGISASQFATDLKALGNVEALDIFINSPGGYVMEGRTIYNRLKAHPAHKTVHVDGEASSIASLIAMAGNEIVMGEGALMLVHRAWNITVGNAIDHQKSVKDLLTVDGTLVATYAAKTGMKADAILKLMEEDRYMDADETVERGFADKAEEAMKAVALISADRLFLHLPELPKAPRKAAAMAKLAALSRK